MNSLLGKYRNLPIQVKASFWYLICSFIQRGVSFITTPIFTRLLTTVEYGKFNVYSSWMSIISVFVTFNLYAGVYAQGLVKFDESRDIFSSSLQGLSLVLTIIWICIYLLFKSFWNKLLDLSTVQMLAMFLTIWASSAFNFWAIEKRTSYQYRSLILVTLIITVFNPAISVLLIQISENKVTGRILGIMLVEMVVYSFCFAKQINKGKCFFSKGFWRYALSYNLPLIPHYLSQTALSSADRIMISEIAGEGMAGIYSLAYSLAIVMMLFNSSLINTMSPWIYQKIKSKENDKIAHIAYLSLGLIATVNLILICFAPEFIALLAPASYMDAIWLVPPIAMSTYFIFCYDLFAKFGFYYEKTRYIMFTSIFTAVLNIILNNIFIRKYGYYAAAYTTLLCYIIYAIVHYLFMCRLCNKVIKCKKPYNLVILLVITCGYLCTGFIVMATYSNTTIRYVIILVALILAVIKKDSIIHAIKSIITTKGLDTPTLILSSKNKNT